AALGGDARDIAEMDRRATACHDDGVLDGADRFRPAAGFKMRGAVATHDVAGGRERVAAREREADVQWVEAARGQRRRIDRDGHFARSSSDQRDLAYVRDLFQRFLKLRAYLPQAYIVVSLAP